MGRREYRLIVHVQRDIGSAGVTYLPDECSLLIAADFAEGSQTATTDPAALRPVTLATLQRAAEVVGQNVRIDLFQLFSRLN